MAKHTDTVPIEVTILTADHDIKGVVHVSKYTNTNRELTDLLNDKERRFLAVTNAEIYPRVGNQSPRRYNFLEIHMDYVLMVHPTTQAVFKDSGKTLFNIREKVFNSVIGSPANISCFGGSVKIHYAD